MSVWSKSDPVVPAWYLKCPDTDHHQDSVWRHILQLLSPAPLHSVVSEEVLLFVQSLNACGEKIAGPSCMANHFWLYLDGPSRHPWNHSAGAVFADNYISYHKLMPSANLIDSLVEDCLKWIKTLKSAYSRSLRSGAEMELYEKKTRRDSWKVMVSIIIHNNSSGFWRFYDSYSTGD